MYKTQFTSGYKFTSESFYYLSMFSEGHELFSLNTLNCLVQIISVKVIIQSPKNNSNYS